MADSATWGSLAGPIGTVVGAGVGAISQGSMNKKTRKFTEQMYARQRADALTDWQMQNAYNSPEQQMQRLKAAGLNPNLVYGNGAEAMSNQGPRSSDAGSWNPQNPDYAGIGSSLVSGALSYVDMKAKTAQTDNIRAQTQQVNEQVRAQQMDNAAKALTYMTQAQATNAGNEAIIKTAKDKAVQELYNLSAQGDVLDFQAGDLNQSSILKSQQISTEQLRRKIMIDENDRAWIMNASNVKEAKSRIVSMAVANAKSEVERRVLREAMQSKQFENWMNNNSKDFYEGLNLNPEAAKIIGNILKALGGVIKF